MRNVYTLPHLILNAADRFPDKDAFRFNSSSLTYEELSLRMEKLAYILREYGVKKGDKVGVYLPRSLESSLAIYGIMQAGAAYVPLDPDAPTSRIQYLIQDCNIRILITHPSQKRKIPSICAEPCGLSHIIGLPEGLAPIPSISWEEVKNSTTAPLKHRIQEHDLAYIMYTSGSTGKPKGIMHTHHSGMSYAKLSADLYDLQPEDRLGTHSPLHFDISTMGYFTSPLVAATSVIISDAHTKLPASLSSLMEKERLTLWYSVPLALIQLLTRGVIEERDLSSLRWVLFGGEPFPPKHLRKLMESWPNATFCNVYGPAEVNQCTYYHLPAPPENDAPIPLGTIWENTEGIILDKEDREVDPGETGELLIRSATRMRGYWNNQELTDRSFFTRNKKGFQETFYRTGDLVRRNEEGLLEFLGRKDRQVKVRGYRVELSEIEAHFISHPSVYEVAIFPTKDKEGESAIEACVILNEGTAVEEPELRAFLANLIPAYAIPSTITLVKSFPRTSTGKINYLELRNLYTQ